MFGLAQRPSLAPFTLVSETSKSALTCVTAGLGLLLEIKNRASHSSEDVTFVLFTAGFI